MADARRIACQHQLLRLQKLLRLLGRISGAGRQQLGADALLKDFFRLGGRFDALLQQTLLLIDSLPGKILRRHRLCQREPDLLSFINRSLTLPDGCGHLGTVFAPKIKRPAALQSHISQPQSVIRVAICGGGFGGNISAYPLPH